MIKNGSDISISNAVGTLPQLGGILDGWLRKLIFIKVVTSIVNYKTVSVETEFQFQGVWQPLSNSEVKMKQEHERAWKWYNCHSKTDLELKNDDIITYKEKKYKIMNVGFYDDYGYYNYHLIEAYQ